MYKFIKIENNIVVDTREDSNKFFPNVIGEESLWILHEGDMPGIGYTYDYELKKFKCPQPYISWIWNNDINAWQPPIPHPNDGQIYNWNEETQTWDLINYQS